jgi:branched-chain amino acid transport system ATP-binding protein
MSAVDDRSSGPLMLELDSVTAGYGSTMILRDVSIEVAPSSVVALLGPNGAGKTTLLRVASGFVRPRSGTVRLDGVDVTATSAATRAQAGLCQVPEGRGVFPSLTVRENIILQAPKGATGPAIERAAELFPVLGRRLSQVAGSLSGGEQQMLSLLRAYVSNPKLVVVDEASLGLAPLIVDEIFEALRGIVRSGTSLLIVEQYIHRALDLANSVYVLNRGEIVFSGPAADLRADEVFERYLGIEVPA